MAREYVRAKKAEIPQLVAMHITPKTSEIYKPLPDTKEARFYSKKLSLYYEFEKEGIIVAKENGRIIGMTIVISSMKKFKNFLRNRRTMWGELANVLSGYYGFDIKKFVLLFLSVFCFPKSDEEIPDAKIIAVIVNEEYRGQGIAREMLERSCDYLRSKGIKKVAITALPSNISALKSYEKVGFRKIGEGLESLGRSIILAKELK